MDRSILPLFASAFASALAADQVTITPWCANSVRVQVQPSGSALNPTPGALKNRVSDVYVLPTTSRVETYLTHTTKDMPMTYPHNLARTARAQALVEDCTPGAGVPFGQNEGERERASVTNGNLVVSSTGANEMTFTQADTSKTLLMIKYVHFRVHCRLFLNSSILLGSFSRSTARWSHPASSSSPLVAVVYSTSNFHNG